MIKSKNQNAKLTKKKLLFLSRKKIIKSLEKEKIAYEEYKKKVDEETRLKELLDTIKNSGKTIEEIEAFVKSDKKESGK